MPLYPRIRASCSQKRSQIWQRHLQELSRRAKPRGMLSYHLASVPVLPCDKPREVPTGLLTDRRFYVSPLGAKKSTEIF